MLVVNILLFLIAVLVLGFMLGVILYGVGTFISDTPVEGLPWQKSHLEDPRAEKSRNKILAASMLLGFLIATGVLFIVFFTDRSPSDLLITLAHALLDSVSASTSLGTLSGVTAGVFWAIHWERYHALKKKYNANETATVDQKYSDTRRLWRNTALASTLVFVALLVVLFYPVGLAYDPGDYSILIALTLVAISTMFVKPRAVCY